MDIRDLPILRARPHRAAGNDTTAGCAEGSVEIIQLVVTGRCPMFRSPAVIDPRDGGTRLAHGTLIASFGLVVDNDAWNLMVRVPARVPPVASVVAARTPSAE